ncbi:MAG: acetyl-CoA carboxylase biotin carboxyl carrier protein [Gaiellaceae bacterium]
MSEADSTKAAPDEELIRSVWAEARELIKKLEGSTVQRLRVEAGEYKIEIERGGAGVVAGSHAPTPVGSAADAGEAAAEAAELDHRHPIIAPLVGTFYRSPQPGAKPFVEEGDVVDEGQTVAIVEAMKLMNQVSADQGGRIAEVVAADGDWVEFEQVLMYLEPVGE